LGAQGDHLCDEGIQVVWRQSLDCTQKLLS
jgi:hypothetical protein